MACFLLYLSVIIYAADEAIHRSRSMEKKRKSIRRNTKKPGTKKKTEYVEPDDFSTLRDVPIYWEPPKKQTGKKVNRNNRKG